MGQLSSQLAPPPPRDGPCGAVTSARFHDDNDAIVLELGFNRPTWLADSSSCNHETFLLEMILPRVLASHNVGRMSLLGYANGAGRPIIYTQFTQRVHSPPAAAAAAAAAVLNSSGFFFFFFFF